MKIEAEELLKEAYDRLSYLGHMYPWEKERSAAVMKNIFDYLYSTELSMKHAKVEEVGSDFLRFEGGTTLTSDHESDCYEKHYLCLSDLTLDDFDGLEFDLTTDDFFERIEGYGIALKPLVGYPVRIPGYGKNNGYYSSNLSLILSRDGRVLKNFDISDCQEINYY